MTDQHPITPPTELVHEWTAAACEEDENTWNYFATWAAQWGADQELEACCEWLEQKGFAFVDELRAARHPKPPSLAEEALETLKYPKDLWSEAEVDTIRRALEALPE